MCLVIVSVAWWLGLVYFFFSCGGISPPLLKKAADVVLHDSLIPEEVGTQLIRSSVGPSESNKGLNVSNILGITVSRIPSLLDVVCI